MYYMDSSITPSISRSEYEGMGKDEMKDHIFTELIEFLVKDGDNVYTFEEVYEELMSFPPADINAKATCFHNDYLTNMGYSDPEIEANFDFLSS